LNVVPQRILLAAQEVLDVLSSHGHPACAIGGLAVLRWGQPRVTQDADISVLAPFGEEADVIDLLVSRFPTRRPDAKAFAKARRVLVITATNGAPVDVGLAALPFEREALERAKVWTWSPDIAFLVCSAEDLIIYKLAAGRPHDLVDVDGIVRLQWRRLDINRIRSRAGQLSEMLEGPDLLAPFERALVAAKKADLHRT
jgi:hypothetical protein